MPAAPKSAAVFRAVADPTRRALLELLVRSDRSVGELVAAFRISQPAISQHLGVLRRAGLVRVRRQGRRRLYQLVPRPLESIYDWASRFRVMADPAGHLWSLGPARMQHSEEELWPSKEPAPRRASSRRT